MKALYQHPKVTALISFFLLGGIGLGLTWTIYLNYLVSSEQEVEFFAEAIEQNIRRSLNNSFSAALTLAFTLDNEGNSDEFELVAAQILDRHAEIAAVQLVPGGVISQVYPLEGNEVVIGYDILENPATKIEAEEAIRRREMFFAGPLPLKQGGTGIVGRLPIFINNAFWGFSAIIIRLDDLLQILNSTNQNSESYYFEFSKIDPNTGEREYFLKTPDPGKHIASKKIQFRTANWDLEIFKPFYFKDVFGIILLGFFSIGFGVMSSVFVFNILRKPSELDQMLQLKTSDLIKSEEKIRALLQAFPDPLFILNQSYVFTFLQKQPGTELYKEPENILGHSVWEVFDTSMAEQIQANVNKALHTGNLIFHEYSLEYPKGKRDFEARYIKINSVEVLVIIRDVSFRNRQINAIKDQNKKLKEIAWMQSHEVRGPLSRMIGLIQLMRELPPSEILPHDEIIVSIQSAAFELDEIIGKIVKEAQVIEESEN